MSSSDYTSKHRGKALQSGGRGHNNFDRQQNFGRTQNYYFEMHAAKSTIYIYNQ